MAFSVNPGGQGDFTTITAAMAVATSGVVVYLAPATYNESFVMPAGVTLTSLPASDDLGAVYINGTITLSASGNYCISNIQLQASSGYSIVISGSGVVNVFIDSCSLISVGAYSVNYSNSNSSSQLLMYNCVGDIFTGGSAHFISSCPGIFYTFACDFNNTILSTAANLISAGTFQNFNCFYNSPIITSGTAQFASKFCDYFSPSTPCLTLGGSGNGEVNHSYFKCNNSAVPIVINTILTTDMISVNTQGSTAIGGTGTIIFGVINIVSNGIISPTLKQTDQTTYIGQIRVGSNVVVPNGGTVTLLSGSSIQVQSGATLNLQSGSAVDIPLTGILIGQGAGNGVTASSITNHGLLIGGASQTLSYIADVAAGQVLVSGGVSANPSFSAYPNVTGLGLSGSSAGSTSGLTFDGTSFMSAYSVGTWTPTIAGTSTAGVTTYSTQTGSYVKIGRLVFIQGYVLWTAATGTGTIAMGGLPYAPTGSPTYQQAVIHSNVAIGTATAYDCSIQSSSTILIGGVIVASGTLVASSLASNQSNYIYVTACYES